ncbi:MAG TPA: VWA domain-containing protein [Candidatus Limnocylindria bacterium]|nr:VWA domain-containing protein [Candidatus Limnocylindria bacterium]
MILPGLGELRLADPWALTLLALVAAAGVVAYRRERARRGGVLFSSHSLLASVSGPRRAALRWIALPLRAAAAVLLVFALAKPEVTQASVEVPSEGIDIVLALDVSSSMSQDYAGGGSKIQATKKVIDDFLKRQSQDRVGIVVFAGEGLVLAPLTLDYDAPRKLLEPIEPGKPVPDGTAIGVGLAVSLNVLRDSQAKAKAVVLLTDGENNLGDITPLDAAELARVIGVRVYTIGAIARRGGDSVDEQMLQRMAQIAGGKYYRADSGPALAGIYGEIQTLERSRVGTRVVGGGVRDAQLPFLLAALSLIVIEVVLATTLLRRVP